MLDPAGEVGVVGKPAVAEGCLALEIGDAVLGPGIPRSSFSAIGAA
jgi:hypothetical protein